MISREFIRKHQHLLVGAIIVLCMLVAFWIRILPATHFNYADYIGMSSPDAWYNLRQIELMIHNFPRYPWFDPMTAFPFGKKVDWGPLFPAVAAAMALLLGATARPDFMVIASYIGPVIAAVLVLVLYLGGRYVGDTWTGITAALFISVGTLPWYYRTTFGYIDHHGLETLLSTVFMFTYLWAVCVARTSPVSLTDRHSLTRPVLLAAIAGAFFVLGLLNMPTMILFAFIVAMFTGISFIHDYLRKTSSDYLLVVNVVTFLIVLPVLPVIGMHEQVIALFQYSFGHFLCYVLLVLGTMGLWALGRYVHNRAAYFVAIILAMAVAIAALFRTGQSILREAIIHTIGEQTSVATITEMQGLDLSFALVSYHYGIILAAAGMIIILWKTGKERDPLTLFLVVWSAFMAVAAFQARRFEYYFAVNFALLCGVAVSWTFSALGKDALAFSGNIRNYLHLSRDAGKGDIPEKSLRKKRPKDTTRSGSGRTGPAGARSIVPSVPHLLKTLVIGIVILLATLSVVVSVNNDITYARSPFMIDPEWARTLQWMNENTPLLGVDYFGIYDRETFTYPDDAYGVMAWWDYGHYITFIGQRIPNTNPFQDNLAGPDGAAGFFMAQDEERAVRILSRAGSAYVITDIALVQGKLHAIAQWYNSTAGIVPYRSVYYFPSSDVRGQYDGFEFLTPEYFRTMIARLHLSDGSLVTPTTAYYLEYKVVPGLQYPVVTVYEELPVDVAGARAARYNEQAIPGTGATVLSTQVVNPVEGVPALRHFRLVFESAGDSSSVYAKGSDPVLMRTSRIKIFELVTGARIRGEGTIEVEILTNTGRQFTYRQESVNGEFVVPYATTGYAGEVRTTGNYRVVGTRREYVVDEEDVIEGKRVERVMQ